MTVHSRSGRFLSFDFCLPFSSFSLGSRLLLLKRSFISFLLLLCVTGTSLISFIGPAAGWLFSLLCGSLIVMTGSSGVPGTVAASLSLLLRPVNLDKVIDSRFSPLWLVGRLLLPGSHVREPRRETERKSLLSSSGVGGSVRPRDWRPSSSSNVILLRRLLEKLMRPVASSEVTDPGCASTRTFCSDSSPTDVPVAETSMVRPDESLERSTELFPDRTSV
jgi:hypothetical protein